VVPAFYDDLLGKVCAWGSDRPEAIARMARALGLTRVEGVASTVPALARVVAAEDFARAAHWTTWLEQQVDLSDLAGPATGGGAAPDFTVTVGGTAWPVRLYRQRPSDLAASGADAGVVTSPLSGTLVRLEVAAGQEVAAGALLAVVEAMKMETPLRAPFRARVAEVRCSVGDAVGAGETVMILQASEDGGPGT
jgi:acetyl-CoA/propionyl-CoA carboxylase biotin carboxyl carrier protein